MSSAIVGNGSEEIKAHLKDIPKLFLNGRPNSFAASILRRLTLAEVTIKSNVIEPQRKESLVVYTITVEEGELYTSISQDWLSSKQANAHHLCRYGEWRR